ncbi:ESX secretion-associated protein EspG [Nocardia sp. NPDC058658]|uniref:ESX secretion-associated protein EspG n=1 Tax=Nocardia sp. NPDC058658 TaxID=3346580 RepID=UPI003654D1D1
MTKPPTWTLTCDEFAWVWRQETRFDDAYDHPDPLAVRTTPTTEADADKLRTVLSERFPRGGDRGLSAVFTILSNADTRVACVSTIGNTEIRSHGAALDGLGVVAAQRFTPNEGGGDVRLALVSRALVPAHLAAILPKAEPGGAGPMLGYTPRVRGEESPTHWTRDAEGRLPVDERIRKLMRISRSAEGYFVIERDPGTRPIRYLSWIDIPPGQFASGRYLIEVDDNDTTVTPADPAVLAREISKRGYFHATPKRQDDR